MKKWPKIIKALVDYPNSGTVRKGEIGIHVKNNTYNFPSQSPYSVEYDMIGKKYEIVNDEPQYEIY